MPLARAIGCKSGLAPASTLRTFRFYPYIPIASPAQQQHTLCRPRILTQRPKPAQRVSLPQSVVNEKD